MEAYQSILTDRDPQNLHEERRDPQLESQETILNERIMNMLKIMSHDIRGPLISDLLPTEWVILVNLDCWKHTS
jgi:hypothetical protein